jgi:hypothetical protein
MPVQELEELALKVMATQQGTQARLEARREEMAAVVSEFERKKKEVRCHKMLTQRDAAPVLPTYSPSHWTAAWMLTNDATADAANCSKDHLRNKEARAKNIVWAGSSSEAPCDITTSNV